MRLRIKEMLQYQLKGSKYFEVWIIHRKWQSQRNWSFSFLLRLLCCLPGKNISILRRFKSRSLHSLRSFLIAIDRWIYYRHLTATSCINVERRVIWYTYKFKHLCSWRMNAKIISEIFIPLFTIAALMFLL